MMNVTLRLLLSTLAVLVTALGASSSLAQQIGTCAPGMAERDLDVNDVNARVFNGGNLFYGNTTVTGDGYLVPKDSGHSPIFNMQLWVGGLVDGELRAAGANYNNFEFWPGPLDASGNPPDDCAQYDRIYLVSRSDIAHYDATGEVTDDLRDWPVELGAPVIDGDGIEGNYDLEGGDRPAISGEQMAWWVMNDAGNEHEWTETPPIGIEVRVEAFAASSAEPAIDQATFYRYRIRYRGEQPLDSAYVALFTDLDIGDAANDYIASDTIRHMAVGYNAEETDVEYGIPPAVGVKVLQGPIGLPNGRDDDGDSEVNEGERLTMTSNTVCQEEPGPYDGTGNYNCMRGRARNGDPIREGGFLNGTGPVTRYMFPGDPVAGAFWSQENYDGMGNPSPGGGGDAFVTPGMGPFRMEPGEEQEFVFAIVFAQGAGRLDSVLRLRSAAETVQAAFDTGFLDPQPVDAEEDASPTASHRLSAFPNPFRTSASLTLSVPDGAGTARLAVYDVLGREVAVLADGVLAPGERVFTLDGAALPAGVYFVRLKAGRQTESVKLLHVE